MLKPIALFAFSFFLSGCCVGPGPSNQFNFTIQNNCTYPVSAAHELLGITKNYTKIAPQSAFTASGASSMRCGETYEDAERSYLTFGHKIYILYPDGHEDIMTDQEFAAKAEAQMGRKGDGNWTLTLCPEQK